MGWMQRYETPESRAERDASIYHNRQKGSKFSDIGAQHGVSQARACQIYAQQCRLRNTPTEDESRQRRDEAIYDAIRAGAPSKEVAEQYGMTGQNVHRIHRQVRSKKIRAAWSDYYAQRITAEERVAILAALWPDS